jgi:MtN3 and saliva related transmembrane protein
METVWLGYLAGFLTTVCTVPQIIKTYKTKKSDELSLLFLAIMVAGLVLWLAYGLMTSEPALIAANSVSLCLVGSLLAMKLRYG